MRKLLVIAMLLLVPATGLRVICTDALPEVPAAAGSGESEHCRQVCARPVATASGMICALTTDATVTVEVALLGPPALVANFGVDRSATPCCPLGAERCATMTRTPQSPPPKA